MAKGRRAWRAGDFIQVAISGSYRYLQFIGKDAQRIDVLRVLNVNVIEPTSDIAHLEAAETLYWVESLCRVLVEDDRFTYVGRGCAPATLPLFRRRFIGGWLVIDGANQRFAPNPIDEETAAMPVEEVLPAEEIVRRLISNWKPEMDRDDFATMIREDSSKFRKASKKPRETLFFVRFPTAELLHKAVVELKRRGFDVAASGDDEVRVRHCWSETDSFSGMDVEEVQVALICQSFDGILNGRETSM